MIAGGNRLASDLLARRAAVLADYKERLSTLRSPLVGDDIWGELVAQAERILEDCAQTLRQGRAVDSETHLPDIIEMATRRGERGIHPKNSVRAAGVLFEVVLAAANDVLRLHADDGSCLVREVALTLSRRIGARLEAGAIGYDTFLLNQVRGVVDADRKDLAREIHDRIGNSVSLAMRQLELTRLELPADPAAVRDHVRATETVLSETLLELRELITGLRRSRAEGALHTALEAYVASLQLAEPDVSIAVNGVESWAGVELLDEIFMILRESLRNVVAHAHARRVTIKVDVAPHELCAAVEDDGIGFDLVRQNRSPGNGLTSMRERAEMLAGQLTIRSRPGAGTRLTLWVPLPGLG